MSRMTEPSATPESPAGLAPVVCGPASSSCSVINWSSLKSRQWRLASAVRQFLTRQAPVAIGVEERNECRAGAAARKPLAQVEQRSRLFDEAAHLVAREAIGAHHGRRDGRFRGARPRRRAAAEKGGDLRGLLRAEPAVVIGVELVEHSVERLAPGGAEGNAVDLDPKPQANRLQRPQQEHILHVGAGRIASPAARRAPRAPLPTQANASNADARSNSIAKKGDSRKGAEGKANEKAIASFRLSSCVIFVAVCIDLFNYPSAGSRL